MEQLVIVKPADGVQQFTAVARAADVRLQFLTPGRNQAFFFEVEGDIQVAGGGGGSVALYHDTESENESDAVGGYAVSIDGGAYVRRTSFSDPVAGPLTNGVHHIRMVGSILQGVEGGVFGVELGLNTQPGGATLTRLIGMILRVMPETMGFE